MPTYGRFSVALEQGKSATVRDAEGREYIDFGSGIGVNSLGYADPEWAAAVAEQAGRLQHISNLYYNETQSLFAQEVCRPRAWAGCSCAIPGRRPTNAPSSWPANTARTSMDPTGTRSSP